MLYRDAGTCLWLGVAEAAPKGRRCIGVESPPSLHYFAFTFFVEDARGLDRCQDFLCRLILSAVSGRAAHHLHRRRRRRVLAGRRHKNINTLWFTLS